MQRIVALSVICVTLRCLAAAQEANSTQAFLDRCVTMQREVDEQRQALNELFLTSLAEGVENGAWTESDRIIARDAYEEMVRPIAAEANDSVEVQRRSKAKRTPQRMGGPPTAPMRATTAVESWFLTRHYYLDLLFDRITASQASAAVEYAEELWLQARKAADLAPAVRPLLDVRERGVRWPMMEHEAQVPRRTSAWSGRGSEVRLRCMEAFDAWTIVASPDGLLPPDPEVTPEGVFSQWQQSWETLRGLQLFVTRPKIDARYLEVIGRRAEARGKAEQGLIDLILKDAPVAELTSAVMAMARFYPEAPQSQRPAPTPPRPGPTSLDYRSIISRPGQPARVPDPRQGMAKWNYGPYLAWRKAIEEGSNQAPRLQDDLMKNLAWLPPEVSAHVREKVAEYSMKKAKEKGSGIAPPAESTKAVNDLEGLIAEVQSVKAAGSLAPGADALTELVSVLQRGISDELTSYPVEAGWGAVAASARGGEAFALRDKIGRARIAELKLSGELDNADTPLVVIYRHALENAVETGQIAAAEAALAYSRLLAILPREEAQEWASFFAALKTSDRNSTARGVSMRAIIGGSGNPAIMRVAALQLK